MTCRNSRTFPGHAYSSRARAARGEKVLAGTCASWEKKSRKFWAQRRDVFAALAQGINLNGKHRKAVIKVVAEASFLNQARKVGVGGGDNAGVDVQRIGTAQALDFSFLQESQELGLHRERKVTHFVEEHGAALRHLDAPHAGLEWLR